MKSTNTTQRQPSKGTPPEAKPADRAGDRLLQFNQVSEITTLSPATLRWLRHRGEGPPLFKLGRRLVCWESDLYAWIDDQAAKQQARAS